MKVQVGLQRALMVMALAASFAFIGAVSDTSLLGAGRAEAVVQLFCAGGPSSIPAYGRCIGRLNYLYGVGYYAPWTEPVGQNVCIGAKTLADGSGGNAIAFTCLYVAPDTTRWTPGGLSNSGYPTVINQEGYSIYGAGMMNYRP